MQILKQKLFLCCAILCAALSTPNVVEAKHIIGGDVTYEYVANSGPNAKVWRFTMKIYRDCFGGGATFDTDASIAIYRGTYQNNVMYENFYVNYDDFTRLIPDTPQCVTKIPSVCVEEAVYVFERTLPVTAAGQSYFVVYQRCCRNESITNILSPGSIGATYSVELTNEAQLANNNSPVFKNFPPIIICNNLPLDFDHSAIDQEGDLLLYEFCSPHAGGGPIVQGPALFSCDGAKPEPSCPPPFDNVPFIVPTYTPEKPMGGNPVVSINQISGLITGTPLLLGQFVVGVCVKEFRNGQLLSIIKREFQFNVADCQPDVFTKIETDSITFALEKYVIKSCGSKTVHFENLSGQPQFIDNFRWEFDMLGTTITDATNWSPSFTFPDTGMYFGKLILNPSGGSCSDTADISVRIYPEVTADFSYVYDTCVAGPVVFTDLSTSEAGIFQWQWDFGIPGAPISGEQHPEYLYPIPGKHPVSLFVIDGNVCSTVTTKEINYYPAPPIIIIRPDSYLGCAPADIFFDNLSTPIDNTYKIDWTFGDGGDTSGVISPTHLYTKEGVYDVSVAITSPIGCFISDTFFNLIRVEPRPVADFTCDPMEGLTTFNNTVHFTDKSVGAAFWNWQIGPEYVTLEQNPTYTFPDTGVVKVRLIVTHPEGCKDSLSKFLDIRPEIKWYMPNAFTPNSDSKNDGFLGKGFLEGVEDFQFSIWNRWGEQVFSTSNPEEAWNGRKNNNGGMSPPGVYVYVVTFTGPRNEPHEYKGYVTLVR
ncbi:MAG: gliding motility-associated C-terminal domain-containing protein [Saprospiraceae bacterium]|nr:gliding motility-associated C-terminal domain-containing protein [Saprospiraceae bacterium]